MDDDSAVEVRHVAGYVDKDGKKLNGTGFDVRRTTDGRYSITFRPPFDTLYGAAATQVGFPGGGNNTLDNAIIYDIDAGGMFVATGNQNGGTTDRAFTFVVVGVGPAEPPP